MKKNKKAILFSCFSVLAIGIGVAGVALAQANDVNVFGSEKEIWNHYTAVDATCSTKGIKEYWVGCSSHKSVFEEPAEYLDIVDKGAPEQTFIDSLADNDARLVQRAHKYDNDSRCSICGRMNLFANTGAFVNKDALTLTNKVAPKGFTQVYHYADKVGGGENSNTLFTSNMNLMTYSRFQYAIFAKAGKTYQVHNTTTYTSKDLPVPQSDTWITITVSKNSDSSWTITNDLGNFQNTGSNSFTVTPDALRVNKVFIPRFEPASDYGFDITEMLADNCANQHVHTFEEDGVCSTCHMKMLPFAGEDSVLRNPSSVTVTKNVGAYGFEHMYYCSEAAGGGAGSNCFVKHTVPMPSCSHIEFAMYFDNALSARIYCKKGPTDAGASQIAFPSVWWTHKGGMLKMTMDKVEDGVWTVTNDYGNFGTVSSTSFTAYTDDYLWTLVRPLTNSGFYISEILYR